MTRTTPRRPVSVAAVFPELAPYRGRTTRLHPRPGRPGRHDSHVGGSMLWPYGEPWPICREPHRRGSERAERFIADPPEVPAVLREHELPEPCVLHPEEVDTYPWAEDGTLPDSLIALIDAWDDAQVAEHGPDAPCYQYDLSIPPGWRVGGFPSWASTGPMHIGCGTCATPMQLLLTAEGSEMDGGSHSWVPLEDRDPALRGMASIRGGRSVARPTRLRFGRDRDLHVFTCPADPRHTPRWVLS